MAVSNDGVHWDEIGNVLKMDDDMKGLGTGSIWKAVDFEESGRFIMNYSSWPEPYINSQSIYFAESTDLIHWNKLGKESKFSSDGVLYEQYPEDQLARWDCMYTHEGEGAYLYGVWTANPRGKTGFGFGKTDDGIHWEILPSPEVIGSPQAEIGAVEKIGDKYYALYWGGHRTVIADSIFGPYTCAEKNAMLLGGDAYFTRFFRADNELLIDYHILDLAGYDEQCGESNYVFTNANSRVWFSPLKKAVVDPDGALRMYYWKNNEGMKGELFNLPFSEEKEWQNKKIFTSLEKYDTRKGIIVEYSADGSHEKGILINTNGQKSGYISIGRTSDVKAGNIDNETGLYTERFAMDRETEETDAAHIRLMIKGALVEVYVNDVFLITYSLPDYADGTISIVGDFDKSSLKCWYFDQTLQAELS